MQADKDDQIRTQEMIIANLRQKLAESQRDVANLRRLYSGAQGCIDSLRRENKRLQFSGVERVFGNG